MRPETALATAPNDYEHALAYRPQALQAFVDGVCPECDVQLSPTVIVKASRIDSLAPALQPLFGLLNPDARAHVLELALKCQWRRPYDLPKSPGKVTWFAESRALPDFCGGGGCENQ